MFERTPGDTNPDKCRLNRVSNRKGKKFAVCIQRIHGCLVVRAAKAYSNLIAARLDDQKAEAFARKVAGAPLVTNFGYVYSSEFLDVLPRGQERPSGQRLRAVVLPTKGFVFSTTEKGFRSHP